MDHPTRLAELTAIRDRLVHLLSDEEQEMYPAIDHLTDLIDDLEAGDDDDDED
jgi:hypothetical protein